MEKLVVRARGGKHLIVAGLSFAMIESFLALLLVPPLLLTFVFFLFASILFLLATLATLLGWIVNGVREISVDEATLAVVRGARRESFVYDRTRMRTVKARKGFRGQTIVLTYESDRAAGGVFRRGGRRIVIRADAVGRGDFEMLTDRLRGQKPA